MTQKFVRYGSDVEHIEPDFEQTLQQDLDDLKQQSENEFICFTSNLIHHSLTALE